MVKSVISWLIGTKGKRILQLESPDVLLIIQKSKKAYAVFQGY